MSITPCHQRWGIDSVFGRAGRLAGSTPHKSDGFQRQQPTSGGTVRSSDLQIVVNTSLQTVLRRFSGPESVCSGKADSLLIKAATTLGLLAIMATHPALRRCTPEPWPYYKVSMSGVCSQCYKSWGELFMQSLFWMGTFEVFWSSKRSRV